ncbi:MAG: hypothetical protein PW792_10045 [Acidobacteriaceae bacterium]|nr:hypothetical protein [Acidobacteriaceae bacterium]
MREGANGHVREPVVRQLSGCGDLYRNESAGATAAFSLATLVANSGSQTVTVTIHAPAGGSLCLLAELAR